MSVSELIQSINIALERVSLYPVALNLAADMEIFDRAATFSTAGKEIRAEDFAAPKNADTPLVVRIMRLLVGMGFFIETARETYKPTSLASALVTSSPYGQSIIHITNQNEVLAPLPTYFAKTSYKNPNDAYDGRFQFARLTDLHGFDWIATQPRLQHAFNTVMTIPRSIGRTAWHEYFPVAEKLVVDSPANAVIVDIGGGIGHDLIRFKETHPEIQGNSSSKIFRRECVTRERVCGLDDDGWIFGIGKDRDAVQGFNRERRTGVGEVLGSTGCGEWAMGRTEVIGSG
ncbi:hypothetical protein SBOR_0984 [Sclerotinia borealis F-4128]|uniref:O-methyltransferase dimerisation domain-containing protein n=1 Tax=Sclerotinia borealis (strain F-4128) TaxID=1432307 RepID=W9CVH9_SCLBF|nr:hypothetical protein SBOR_0984 [Sclerotinia borealis F-4128]